MAKYSREHIVTNGKPVFYASIYEDIRKVALSCGWALGLHGSLSNDMDIMAMPWDENASSIQDMIKSISNCFSESPFKEDNLIPYIGKPNGRIVYTIRIWSDFYLDINVISNTYIY